MPDTDNVSPPTAPGAASPRTLSEFDNALEAEWKTYVAVVDIDLQGGRAVNRGGAVPVTLVNEGIVSPDQVAKLTTKAGRAAAGLPDDSKG